MSPLTNFWWSGQQQFIIGMHMATLGTEESGHCKEMDVAESFNPLTALPAKTGRTRLHCFKHYQSCHYGAVTRNTCYTCSKN